MMRYPFPGLTKAQRAALDLAGCGVYTLPGVAPATLKVLTDKGLLVKCGESVLGRDRFGVIAVPEYGMPTPVHIRWCEWQSNRPVTAEELGGEGG